MRSMSLILSGAVALCVVLAWAEASVAQEPETPSLATGVFRMAEGAEDDQTEAGQRWDERDVSAWGWLESSEPRIAGTLGLMTAGETSPDDEGPAFVWGSVMLETDAGTWVGPMAGWLDADRLTIPVWMVGEGAHAGLVAFMDISGTYEEAEAGLGVRAMIYEGGVPPAIMTAGRAAQVGVTGRMVLDEIDEPGEFSEDEGVDRLRERQIEGSIEMSDPRLSGSVIAMVNEDSFTSPDASGRTSLSWGLMGIENDDGAWGLEWSSSGGPAGSGVLVATGTGEDDYEGWSAQLRLTPRGGLTGLYDVEGILVEGELPSLEVPAVPG